jgi:hypothetical protein
MLSAVTRKAIRKSRPNGVGMSHQDVDGRKVRLHADHLRQGLKWLLGKAAWETIGFR